MTLITIKYIFDKKYEANINIALFLKQKKEEHGISTKTE